MKVENALRPEADQIRDFLAKEGPVWMVNLLKFRERAAYPDGRDADLPGIDAYRRYAELMRKRVEAKGGRFLCASKVEGLLLGQVDDLWDHVAIVEYPSASTLVEIASSEGFAELEEHREAGLAGQLNLTTQPVDGL